MVKISDLIIEKPVIVDQQGKGLPIRFAKKPDVNSLFGIWKDRPKTLEALRKKAWGERV